MRVSSDRARWLPIPRCALEISPGQAPPWAIRELIIACASQPGPPTTGFLKKDAVDRRWPAVDSIMMFFGCFFAEVAIFFLPEAKAFCLGNCRT